MTDTHSRRSRPRSRTLLVLLIALVHLTCQVPFQSDPPTNHQLLELWNRLAASNGSSALTEAAQAPARRSNSDAGQACRRDDDLHRSRTDPIVP
ncbi:hypothetical protein SISSUDRAFT_1045760, partial [Sistotremastrum suecicum HHB10207 ss-3]